MNILKSPYIGQRISILLSVILLVITAAYALVDLTRFDNFLYDLSNFDLEDAWSDYFAGKTIFLLLFTCVGALFWPYTYQRLWDWVSNKDNDSAANTKNVFFRIWKGKKSLGFTFWFIFFIPNFIMSALLNTDHRNEIPIVVVLLFGLYFLWSSVGAWRTAKNSSSRFKGHAMAVILLGWAGNIIMPAAIFIAALAS